MPCAWARLSSYGVEGPSRSSRPRTMYEVGVRRGACNGPRWTVCSGPILVRDATHLHGFESQLREVTLDELEVSGSIPNWLSGTLVRNGPARYEVGDRTLGHWFDGHAMLHAFGFQDGRVSYANRYLETAGGRGWAADDRVVAGLAPLVHALVRPDAALRRAVRVPSRRQPAAPRDRRAPVHRELPLGRRPAGAGYQRAYGLFVHG